MNQDDIRLRAASQIAAEPHEYKLCIACGSIAKRRAFTCPVCHSYAFEDDPEKVKAQAQYLAVNKPSSILPEDLK